jgi:hypothetical protein
MIRHWTAALTNIVASGRMLRSYLPGFVMLTALGVASAPAAQTLTILYILQARQTNGSNTSLAIDPTGTFLYGEAVGSGNLGEGTLFTLKRPSGGGAPSAMKVLYTFNGQNPIGGLTLDPNSGVYYGVTQNGGPHVTDDGNGNGTVFRLVRPTQPLWYPRFSASTEMGAAIPLCRRRSTRPVILSVSHMLVA